MRETLTLLIILSTVILTGCLASQERIVDECYKNNSINNCDAQRCAYVKSVGFTGHDKLEIIYLKCITEKCDLRSE